MDTPLEQTFYLLQAAQAGDEAALDSQLSCHLPHVLQIVARRVGHEVLQLGELDGIVQQVLLKILGGLPRFERRAVSATGSPLAFSARSSTPCVPGLWT